jgi:hypothetical protein
MSTPWSAAACRTAAAVIVLVTLAMRNGACGCTIGPPSPAFTNGSESSPAFVYPYPFVAMTMPPFEMPSTPPRMPRPRMNFCIAL